MISTRIDVRFNHGIKTIKRFTLSSMNDIGG